MSFNVISNDFPNNSQTLLDFTKKYFSDSKIGKFNFRTYEKHSMSLFFWHYMVDFGRENFVNPESTMELYDTTDFLGIDEGDPIYYEELKLSELLEFIKNAKKEFDSEKKKVAITNGFTLKVIEGDKK